MYKESYFNFIFLIKLFLSMSKESDFNLKFKNIYSMYKESYFSKLLF